MSHFEFLFDRIKTNFHRPAIGWREKELSYEWLHNEIEAKTILLRKTINGGDKVVLKSDFNPTAIAVLYALIKLKAIIVPLLPLTLARSPRLTNIVDPDFWIEITSDQQLTIESLRASEPHPLVKDLRDWDVPGLILFTSGSSGEPKGVVHDFSRLLQKFNVTRPPLRCLNFLLFDHWGGLNTLFHTLSSGGFVILPEQRQPEYICSLIEHFKVELLPASPTFLNLLLMSQAYSGKNMSTLIVISYGSEPMPTSTLAKLAVIFPNVQLRQTYGLIELGVLRAKSKSNESLLVKVGGDGYEVRVVDGLLEIKAESAMLGYLNAPSPFTSDGYFMTGDRVEVHGDYVRILGRQSELINVGGQKVYPAEVEDVLLSFEEIADAIVYGERHPITGSIVCAKVQLKSISSNENEMRRKIKIFSRTKLETFKVPVKINFTTEGFQNDRMKRMRRQPEKNLN